MEAALAVARLLAFVAGTALFGAPLFALYSGVTPPGLKRLASLAGAVIASAAAATLILQTGEMAGDPKAGLDPATVQGVIAGGAFGASILVRLSAGLGALALPLVVRSRRGLWTASAALGALALGALPWSGHGAADEATAGVIHVVADVAHLLAAGVWLGALSAFGLLLGLRRPDARSAGDLYEALKGFSGIGSGVVAVIVVSGLANSWFLVGPDRLAGLIHSLWGDLLLAKLAVFTAMLGLAGLNRYRLTPDLGAALSARPEAALAALRRSVVLESALGLLVLALVAVLGMQPPPAAG